MQLSRLSLAGGNIIIEDISDDSEAINAILNDDGYKSSSFTDATLIMAHDKKGQGGISHSIIKNGIFDFSADHGEGIPTLNVGYSKAMAGSLGYRKTYYKRNQSDKIIDTNAGKVKGGVRKLNKEESQEFLEKAGFTKLQELINTIYYER